MATTPRLRVGVLATWTLLALASPATWAQTPPATPVVSPATSPIATPTGDGQLATPTEVPTPQTNPAPIAPTGSGGTPTALPATPPLPPNLVRLRIVADEPIDLSAQSPGEEPRPIFAGQREVLLSLPIADVYTVSGSQIPSKRFRLRALPNLRIDVAAGSKGGQVGSGLLIGLGGLGVITGAVALLIGVGNAGLISFLGGGRMDSLNRFWITGAVGLGVGVPLVGGGIALLLYSRTRVRQSSATP